MLPAVVVDSTRAFAYQWIIWRIFGLHPPEGNTFWAQHYQAYGIIINLIANVHVPMSFYIECLLSSNLTEFCETFYLTSVVLVEQVKYFNVWRIRGQLKRFHQILHHLDGRLQHQSERDIVEQHIELVTRIFLGLFRWFVIILTSSMLFVACTAEQELAFPTWYPWNWQRSNRVYLFTVIWQTLSLYSLALMTLSNDTYPMSYMTMVAGHYRALAQRVSMIGHGRESQSLAYEQLIDCIRDHQIILLQRLVSIIQDTMSSVFFYQFACTACSICTFAFYIFFVKVSFSKLLHLFFMFVAIVFETFIICYATEDIGLGAEQLYHAIYACNWLDQSIEFRRTLLLMLNRAQRSVTIVAAHSMPVRMTTFLAVIKTAYSMFTLLNKIKS
ncbi:odorant receptor 19a-like [Drosophila sulfurigaster albostrigata]|uniref:odorant receptor 19a-like n=1 Tax=Drosophila sulfurigaster albostrigata TaxID=89887 RepID=UPI002D21B6E6|nr:odorant receptor 19a-like [Drosophila sulfurigaster albostrigata]